MNYYFHLPFCRSKCGYCAFYSVPAPEPQAVNKYLDHLERELDAAAPLPPPETIYLGGGTPSLLSVPQLKRLFALLTRRLVPGKECEISIEANPETLDEPKTELLREHTTRISLGVQSFSVDLRRTLGRACGDDALKRAVNMIRKADFPHWNIDLIYAVPGETSAMWQDDLRRAADTGADHLSCYSLTPEEGSRLGGSLRIDDDLACDMYETVPEVIAPYGLRRYEVSNCAIPGSECRHNVNVWRGGLLRGFGPSASGFDGIDRVTEVSDLDSWLAGAPPETDRISRESRLAEIFAVNLRTTAGWTPELWKRVPRADSWDARRAAVTRASGNMPRSWWKITPGCIKLSDEGMCFWNTIAEAMLP